MWLNRKASSPANPDRSGCTSSLRRSVCRCEPTRARSSSGESSVTAPHQKTFPTTEARWITARSSSSSWSSRAESSALIVPGTETLARGRRAPTSGRCRARATVVDQLAEHLLDEQRVAFGRVGDPRLDVGGEPDRAQQVRDQIRALVLAERLEDDRLADGRPVRDGSRAGRGGPCTRGHRVVGAEPRDVLQQVEEGRLGPVDVLEQHDERRVRRHDLEEAAHRPEGLLDVAPTVVLAEPDRCRDAGRRRSAPSSASATSAQHLRARRVGASASSIPAASLTSSATGQNVMPSP